MQGSEKILTPSPDRPKDLPCFQGLGPATHPGKNVETEHGDEPKLDQNKLDDLPCFPSSAMNTNQSGEMEHEESGPGPDQPKHLSLCPTSCSATQDDNEETEHEEKPESGPDQSEEMLSPSDSAAQKDENEETGLKEEPGHGADEPLDELSSPDFGKHTNKNEETVITSMNSFLYGTEKITNDKVGIRATDLVLGLRRIPAGFYLVVHHSGLEWKTENKRSSGNEDIEWNGSFPM